LSRTVTLSGFSYNSASAGVQLEEERLEY